MARIRIRINTNTSALHSDSKGHVGMETEITDPPTLDLDSFLETITEEVIVPRSSTITITQKNEILNIFSKQQDLSLNEALVVTTILFQSGGTAKSCDGNLQCIMFGKTIKLAYLRKALAEAKCKGLERKFARSIADDIIKISNKLKIAGNLSQKILRANPERTFTMEETFWLSDFQSENLNCPEILRNFITKSFETRVSNSSKPQTKKTNKTGK